jgi:transposase
VGARTPEHLGPTDQVVREATTNAWTRYDPLAPLVQEVQSAHPVLITLMRSTRVKTATRATRHLARLLAAGLIPEVWVPPLPVRDLRVRVAQRQRLVRQRTPASTRLPSVLHTHPRVPPGGRLGSPAPHAGWDARDVPTVERWRVQQDLTILQTVAGLIATVDAALSRLSTPAPWKERMRACPS